MTAAKGQPKTGGTLRVGNLGDLPNADGHWISGQNVIYPVYDRLVDLDASLQPHPALAESWDVNSDYTQITFKIRKGVNWHSGRELTAEDIAWNYNRIKSDRKIDGGIKANFFVPLGSRRDARQEHARPARDAALAGGVQRAGMDQYSGSAGTARAEQARRHRTIHVRRVGAGRPLHAEEEPELLAIGQTVPRWRRDQDLRRSAIDGLAAGRRRHRLAIQPLIRDALRLAKDAKYQLVYNQNSGSVNVILTQTRDGAGPTTNKLFRQALNASMDRQRWTESVLPSVGSAEEFACCPEQPGV